VVLILQIESVFKDNFYMKNGQIIEEKIQRHNDFWKKTNETPLIGYSLGNYFVSKRFNAVDNLLGKGRCISADDFKVESFLLDYDKMYDQSIAEGSDLIFSACPFTGLPWIEALLGCKVIPQESSFMASPISGADFCKEVKTVDNSWSDKYDEFIDGINKNSKGRYPVGQPILRGPGDVLAGIFKPKELIYFFYDYPEHAKKRLNEVSDVFLSFIKKGLDKSKDFYGGYSMGFYPIWCPGKALWFQDDITALLSPELYDEFFLNIHQRHANVCEYSMIHLHPGSFYLLDRLIAIDALRAIQINKDIEGPSVLNMLPTLRHVQSKKNLVLWGDFSDDELKILTSELDAKGLFIIVHRDRISN
jgi:hypothetical protein